MSAIPIPQQGDTDDPEELIRRMGASSHNAIPLPDMGTPPTAQPQLVKQSGQAIPTGRVGGIQGTIDPDTSLYNAPPAHQAGVASLWSKAENIHNPVLRVAGKIGAGLLRGIDVAGSIAAPGIAANIPGSTLNAKVGENRERRQASEDVADQEREAVTAHTQAETAGIPAQTAHTDAETKALENPQPKPKEEDWSVVPNMVGPNGEVFQQEKSSGQIRPAPGMTGVKPLHETAEPDKDKDIGDYLQANKLPDTPANREKARSVIANRGKQEPGNYMPLYDPKTGTLVGAWDPKSGHHIAAPNLPGTTSAGAGIANKASAASEKESAPYKQMVESAAEAHQLADMAAKGNAEADVDLALSFFKMMKGSGSGIRFTQAEQNWIKGARSTGQDLLGVAQKVFGEGQPFTPQQRKNVVAVIDMHAKAAQHHLDRETGGATVEGGGQSQATHIYDPATGTVKPIGQ